MGPLDLENANPHGGPMIDEYPVMWSKNYDGHIIKYWETNRSARCTITDSGEISLFVGLFAKKYLLFIIFYFRYGECYRPLRCVRS